MKLVFLIYDARSGSTLLAAMMNRLAGIKVMPETNFPSRLIANSGGSGYSSDPDSIIRFLKKEPHFVEAGIDRSRLKERLQQMHGEDLQKNIIDAIIKTYFGEASDKSEMVAVIKCGGALFHMDRLQRYFPDATFLHIIRDGRAVCASKRETTSSWQRKFSKSVISNALHWKKRIRITEQFTGNLINLKYEELVLNPEKSMAAICDQLELPKSARECAGDLNTYSESIGDRQKHLHKNIGLPDPARIVRWKNVLPWYDIEIFNYIAGEELVTKGYTLESRGDWNILRHILFVFKFLQSYGYYLLTTLVNIVAFTQDGRLFERIRIKYSSKI